ncbi:MAG: hypothetical protein LBU91_00345 [Bacteroidales bacterium]|nr:hypothetical protein [Bacteroidales bacterium]
MQVIKSLILACLLCLAFCGHAQETKQNIFFKPSPIYKKITVTISNSDNNNVYNRKDNKWRMPLKLANGC